MQEEFHITMYLFPEEGLQYIMEQEKLAKKNLSKLQKNAIMFVDIKNRMDLFLNADVRYMIVKKFRTYYEQN